LKYEEANQEFQRGYMSIALIRYVLKTEGIKTGSAKRIYEYIPY
jgi:hypothetical protein